MERTYEFPDGTIVELQEVPALVIEHILNSEAGKPKVPVVEVLFRGHKRKEANPNDPAYLESLQVWEAQKQKRVMFYCLTKGVVDEPPEEFVEEYTQYLPDGATIEDLKYLWLASKLTDEDQIGSFIEAVMGQSTVTEGGLAEAAAKFPSNGERRADSELELQESSGGQD